MPGLTSSSIKDSFLSKNSEESETSEGLANKEDVVTHPILAAISDESPMTYGVWRYRDERQLLCDSLIRDVFYE